MKIEAATARASGPNNPIRCSRLIVAAFSGHCETEVNGKSGRIAMECSSFSRDRSISHEGNGKIPHAPPLPGTLPLRGADRLALPGGVELPHHPGPGLLDF